MDDDKIELIAQLVAAYVSNNQVPVGALAGLIAEVSASIAKLGAKPEPVEEKPQPAVNPKRSVFPDYIVCLDDGKKFKSLTRHLTVLGMTPDSYRAKWGLAADYPMVAPNYAAERSALAKASGLGRKRVEAPAEEPPKRGRKKKPTAAA